MAIAMIGKKIVNAYYDAVDDYHVVEFEDGSETCFRFMACIARDGKD